MNSMPQRALPPRKRPTGGLAAAALLVSLGTLSWAVFWHTVLLEESLGKSMFSGGTWQACVQALGGTVTPQTVTPQTVTPQSNGFAVRLEFAPILLCVSALSVCSWMAGGLLIRTGEPFRSRLAIWARCGWLWWLLPGLWECLRLTAYAASWTGLERAVLLTPNYWFMISCGGWLATGCWLIVLPGTQLTAADGNVNGLQTSGRSPRAAALIVLLGGVLYAAVFTTMNWQLYENLLVPHGDSAMYEEHLWNVTHGKGFRSYLDQGLFLGEHIQVIHLLLIPLHWIWPSHLLLEVCESLALAAGALPVFWIARRHTEHAWAAAALAIAWFLYPPLQFLDIAIDLKTFRPTSFGVPLLLFAIDQFERRRWKTFALLSVLTLACKEDYAIPLCLLGFWIAAMGPRGTPVKGAHAAVRGRGGVSNLDRWAPRAAGLCLAVSSGLYLLWATRVAIPWFREGQEVHYARYFSPEFGESLGEIAWNMLTQPQLLWSELGTVNSLNAVLAMLVPLGLLPLASPTRLLVGAPTLVLLCLNELSQQPHHHFHAPLVPIVFWAAAAGLCRAGRMFGRAPEGTDAFSAVDATRCPTPNTFRVALLGPCCALLATMMSGISPLSTSFWDPTSLYHWRHLYVVDERARAFDAVFASIPQSARVASTDFVHPRFTHHERSYDYSAYRRRISNYELRVPEDTDYIVIDTGHYYSTIKRPEDIPELRDNPDRWELVPNDSSGLFLVLRRQE